MLRSPAFLRERCAAGLGALVLCLSLAGAARAQSAADKATAREVATEGIKLYRAGKYADALDRLRRAQALYDAPVHLLYIARAQSKLGQLVEASENYRLLVRYKLPDGAPDAWVTAVSDGQKELAELEPRIPKLRVVTEPAAPDDAKLTIDGANVSVAVIGISRAINPGKHHVEVQASGRAPAAADVELAEGESKDVTVKLGPAGAETTATAAATSAAPSTPSDAASKPASDGKPGLVGFMAGLRLGAGLPTGTIAHFPVQIGGRDFGRDIDTSDIFQPGGAFELHGGVRIGRYFTPLLFLELEKLSAGTGIREIGAKEPTSLGAGSFGLGVMIGSRPGKIGGFGEFDIAFLNGFSFSQQYKPDLVAGETCDLSASGGAIRLGGGAVFPAFGFMHITPITMLTLGRFTQATIKGGTDCSALLPSKNISSDNQRTHGMLFLGVGGDFVFGSDMPSPKP
jgi:hypothetical protein